MSSQPFFFSNWTPLIRILVVGIPMYVTLVIFLRLSGSRTLSSMNAFDFIVTVAIGSVFGRALTARRVAFAEAIVALGLLISLQYVVTWIEIRWSTFGKLVTNPPALLYFQGEFLEAHMKRQRVSEGTLESAARKEGFDSLDNVEAIVLESSGKFSVIQSVDEDSEFKQVLEEDLV